MVDSGSVVGLDQRSLFERGFLTNPRCLSQLSLLGRLFHLNVCCAVVVLVVSSRPLQARKRVCTFAFHYSRREVFSFFVFVSAFVFVLVFAHFLSRRFGQRTWIVSGGELMRELLGMPPMLFVACSVVFFPFFSPSAPPLADSLRESIHHSPGFVRPLFSPQGVLVVPFVFSPLFLGSVLPVRVRVFLPSEPPCVFFALRRIGRLARTCFERRDVKDVRRVTPSSASSLSRAVSCAANSRFRLRCAVTSFLSGVPDRWNSVRLSVARKYRVLPALFCFVLTGMVDKRTHTHTHTRTVSRVRTGFCVANTVSPAFLDFRSPVFIDHCVTVLPCIPPGGNSRAKKKPQTKVTKRQREEREGPSEPPTEK